MAPKNWKNWIRMSLVILVAIGVVVTIPPVYWWLWSLQQSFWPDPRYAVSNSVPYGPAIEKAIEIRIDFSTASFQIGVLVVAGLWGLLYAEHKHASELLSSWQEFTLLMLASVSVISAYYSHFSLMVEYTSALQDAENPKIGRIPDIDDFYNITYALQTQVINTALIVIAGATAIISGRWLKEKVD